MTSRGVWQQDESYIQFLLTGDHLNKQVAQSIGGKKLVGIQEHSLGDAKNDHFHAECKMRDTMPPAQRRKVTLVNKKDGTVAKKKNRKPGDRIIIDFSWWHDIIEKCEQLNRDSESNRLPILYYRRKFTSRNAGIVIIHPWIAHKEVGILGDVEGYCRKFKDGRKPNRITWMASDVEEYDAYRVINPTTSEELHVLQFDFFVRLMGDKGKVQFSSIEDLEEGWKRRNED